MSINEDPNTPCKDRIAAHLKGRESDVEMLNAALGYYDEEQEAAQEALDSLPLEISTTTIIKVLLSTGGPADYLTCEIESDTTYRDRSGPGFATVWERTSDVVYHFADWFDHAETALPDDSPLVQYMDSIVENWSE